MPGLLLHVGATVICPHGGQVSVISSNSRVLAGGQPVGTFSDTYMIAGCAFMAGPKPQPCVKVQWLTPAARVFVNKQPAILQTSSGLCQSIEQIPQGAPIVVTTQVKAQGS